MNRLLPILAALLLVSLPTYAAQPIVVYSGTAASNGLTLFTTEDMTEFNVCNLVSTVGAVSSKAVTSNSRPIESTCVVVMLSLLCLIGSF